ncbi:hypothetical protein EDB84DRAFT_1445829 [Lactarius hengduanensis]|nr:hypothetical protein EDB84DRAFT_1445829 [Lactarius hengduanensis]
MAYYQASTWPKMGIKYPFGGCRPKWTEVQSLTGLDQTGPQSTTHKCNRSRLTEQRSVEDVPDVDIGWCDGASETVQTTQLLQPRIRHYRRILCIMNEPTAAATIATMVLGKVKETTRAYLGKGTVTVVACLFNTEHQATKDTGTLQAFRSSTLSTTLQQLPSPMDLTRPPSLQILCISNKPTAATITYGFDKATYTRVTSPDLTRSHNLGPRTIAGLQILCITNEPTAATVAQGLDKRSGCDSLTIKWNGLYSAKKTQRPFVEWRVRAHFVRMKLWEQNMTSTSIRSVLTHI